MENVTLTPKEQTRLQVLNSLLAEHMTLDQAATLMGVTTRRTRRILAAYREKGAASLAHGHRGRRPTNATPDAVVAGVVADVVRLARTRYAGASHTHLGELLSERDGIDIGRTTLRRILGQRRTHQPAGEGVRPSTGYAASACPGRACWSRWTAVTTRGWGIRHHRSRC